MRVLVLGGTRFIGRRITEELVRRGDEVLLVHRGLAEPPDWVRCRHLHVERSNFAAVQGDVREFAPEAIVDTLAMTGADADAVLDHLPDVPLVVPSSMDTYRAYEFALAGRGGLAVPLDEESPTRQQRYPHRGSDPAIPGYDLDMDNYDKLDIEPRYLARGGTVLRLGMVYGAGDLQGREEFVLRRVRAGRRRIPVGAANWLWTRLHVEDIPSAVVAAINTPAARGAVFNLGEAVTESIGDWMRRILRAAAWDADLVAVPEDRLPDDLITTTPVRQHVVTTAEKARRVLGWTPCDPRDSVLTSVRWNLAHPCRYSREVESDGTFEADDRALAYAL